MRLQIEFPSEWIDELEYTEETATDAMNLIEASGPHRVLPYDQRNHMNRIIEILHRIGMAARDPEKKYEYGRGPIGRGVSQEAAIKRLRYRGKISSSS